MAQETKSQGGPYGAKDATGARPPTSGPACPLPGADRPATWRETWRTLGELGANYWLKASAVAAGAAVLIGVPTVLIPNPLFVRDVPTTPADYVVFVLSAALIGMTWALPQGDGPRPENRSLLGAFGAFLAVGCPTCNKIVLLLLGSGGALTYFAPVQPLLGAAAVGLMAAALRRRIGSLRFQRDAKFSAAP